MKLIFLILSLVSLQTQAIEDYVFSCDFGSYQIATQPGLKKAPEHPVVGLVIKVIKDQVPLYLVQATSTKGDKNLFVTDWVGMDQLSEDGLGLIDLLSLFMGIDTSQIQRLRAGVPSDLLDTFAYLELLNYDGSVIKLGFEGTDPVFCE